jgi:hypothetical protein
MRKSLVGFVFLAVYLAFTSMPAHAQTVVDLFLTANTVEFTGGKTVAGVDSVLTSIGASGSASDGTNLYLYSLTGPTITLTETSPTSNEYTAVGGPLTLNIAGGAGTLSGTVAIDSFEQTTTPSGGTFNNALTSTVTVLASSGALATNSATFVLGITFKTNTPVDTHGATIFNTGGVGALTPTPEPASMLLFGSGLLAIGGALRRRLLA